GLENHVFLPGYRTDGDNLLRSADCFINASSSEALSFAILEAMEAGLPIIATNIGGNPDIVNENTNCGALVEYNDIQALAKAMEDIMADEAKQNELSLNARLAVKNIFNVDNSVKTAYNIY
ncbi:glycosyltransferase, partial [Tyzzerella sp. OttesenSCG-928-J15]|nr:glycosyltransferase [Tyzzerella sp. OttesenSCG-928-J15]